MFRVTLNMVECDLEPAVIHSNSMVNMNQHMVNVPMVSC